MRKPPKSKSGFWHTSSLALTIVFFLSACATSAGLRKDFGTKSGSSLEEYLNDLTRLDNVAAKILKTAQPLCKNIGRDPGVFTLTRSQFPKQLQDSARQNLGADTIPRVYVIRENGPSNALMIGDVLLGFDDAPVDVNSRDVQTYLAAGFLRIERGGTEIIKPVTATSRCAYRVHLKDSRKINAHMSGGQISVTTAMMDFFTSDDELAYVIGHELAHGFQNHIQVAIRSGGILGLSTRKLRGLETEADYAALTLLAVSGYNIDAASKFWQRLNRAITQGQITGQQMISDTRLSDIHQFSIDVKSLHNNGMSLADMQKPPR